MCGVNSGTVREMRDFVNRSDRSKIQVSTIGDKGTIALQRPMLELMKTAISDISKPVNYPTVIAVSEHIIKASEGSDKIIVYFNEFKSAISTIIRTMELMP